MGRDRASASSSSSSLESSNTFPNHQLLVRPSLSQQLNRDQLTTDLRLGLSTSQAHHHHHHHHHHHDHLPTLREQPSEYWPQTMRQPRKEAMEEDQNECNSATFFVKVYMEGTPIGRKLDLLAHDGYSDLIRTLDLMFDTSIIWAEMEVEDYVQCHVLTYEDKEGDWLMVGDVPWEMFLSSVRRLKITRADKG